jgi:hypothetical protein
MPSTFTDNTGIEKIGDGEQTGAWGQITNDNFDIIDRALNGSVSIALSGTTGTVTTGQGSTSGAGTIGQYAVLVFTGSPSGTNTVTIEPNTAQKTYIVRNTTAQSVVLTQGSGGSVTVLAGETVAVYADGAGVSASVVRMLSSPEVTLTGAQTLTNKTIAFADNTLTDVVGLTATQTLTNKTIAFADNTLTDVVGLTATQTLTNKTLEGAILNDGYTEEVFAVTGTTPALSPTNGSIQTWTLSGNSTPTAGTWASGQSITLLVNDGASYTITWSTIGVVFKTNGGSAPTLNLIGETVIELWKVGTTVYGARVGNA